MRPLIPQRLADLAIGCDLHQRAVPEDWAVRRGPALAQALRMSTQQTHPDIGKGLDLGMMGIGVGMAVIGVAVAYVGFFTRHGVRIGIIPIPLSIVGPLAILAGLAVLVVGLRQEKCLPCKKSLDFSFAWFELEDEKRLIEAITTGDLTTLPTLPMGSGADSHVQVDVNWCPECRKTATVEINRFVKDGAKTPLISLRPLATSIAGPVSAFIDERKKAHEARYEQEE